MLKFSLIISPKKAIAFLGNLSIWASITVLVSIKNLVTIRFGIR